MLSPEQFAKTPRIIGLEMEYSPRINHHILVEAGLCDTSTQFISNGGRLYEDIGGIVEFATPESLGPREAVLYDRAGELLVKNLVGNIALNKRVIESDSKVESIDVRVAPLKTAGHHENYLAHRKTNAEKINRGLLIHCASRVVINGAGAVLRDGNNAPFFSIAQKVWGLQHEIINGTTNSHKGIVNTRDEAHAAKGYRRVHNTSGDPNMSDFAAWLTVASTSLCLRLVEAGVALDHLLPMDPLFAMHQWSKDTDLKQTTELANGKMVTAVNIQESLATLAQKLSQEVQLPDEELLAIDAWLETCDSLNHNPRALVGKLDWITKKHILQRKLGDYKPTPDNLVRAINIDLDYDTLGDGYGEFCRDRGVLETFFTREEVEHASTTPPNTRAAKRVEMQNKFKHPRVNWSEVATRNTVYQMLDPYDPKGVEKVSS